MAIAGAYRGGGLLGQVTAQLVVPADGVEGTIYAQGGSFGGWGLMAHAGATRFVYNLLGVRQFVVDADRPLTAGEHQVRAEFADDGGGLGKGGTVSPYQDGEPVGTGRVEATDPMTFTAIETAEVGRELRTMVLPGIPPQRTHLNVDITWVELTTGTDSHLINPDDIIHMLLSKQGPDAPAAPRRRPATHIPRTGASKPRPTGAGPASRS